LSCTWKLGSAVGGKADTNAGEMILSCRLELDFSKRPRLPSACKPHIQALCKYSTVRPVPLSADTPLCFALSTVKPRTQFGRDKCAKRLRRTHHPDYSPHFDSSHSDHNLFRTPASLVLHFACARLLQSEHLEVQSSRRTSLLNFTPACSKFHTVVQCRYSVVSPNTVTLKLTRKDLSNFPQLREELSLNVHQNCGCLGNKLLNYSSLLLDKLLGFCSNNKCDGGDSRYVVLSRPFSSFLRRCLHPPLLERLYRNGR
jgi:hypothetical protein